MSRRKSLFVLALGMVAVRGLSCLRQDFGGVYFELTLLVIAWASICTKFLVLENTIEANKISCISVVCSFFVDNKFLSGHLVSSITSCNLQGCHTLTSP
jgi:hypothetical protein